MQRLVLYHSLILFFRNCKTEQKTYILCYLEVTLITHVHWKREGKGGERKEREKGREEIKMTQHKRLTNFICMDPASDSCLPLIEEYKKISIENLEQNVHLFLLYQYTDFLLQALVL